MSCPSCQSFIHSRGKKHTHHWPLLFATSCSTQPNHWPTAPNNCPPVGPTTNAKDQTPIQSRRTPLGSLPRVEMGPDKRAAKSGPVCLLRGASRPFASALLAPARSISQTDAPNRLQEVFNRLQGVFNRLQVVYNRLQVAPNALRGASETRSAMN